MGGGAGSPGRSTLACISRGCTCVLTSVAPKFQEPEQCARTQGDDLQATVLENWNLVLKGKGEYESTNSADRESKEGFAIDRVVFVEFHHPFLHRFKRLGIVHGLEQSEGFR